MIFYKTFDKLATNNQHLNLQCFCETADRGNNGWPYLGLLGRYDNKSNTKDRFFWRHNIQHDSTQHYDTQHYYTQHNDTQRNDVQRNDVHRNDVQHNIKKNLHSA